MFEPVRIGVVGFGNFGRLHALTVDSLVEACLVAIVDSCPTARDAARNQWAGVPQWPDIHAAIGESAAEAWIVACSTASHVSVTQAILAAGLTALVEKPLAPTLADAQSLAPLVAADSSNLMAGHVVLFNSEFRALHEQVQQRGMPTFIDCVRHRPAATMQALPGERPFHLLMVHDFYCVLALTNRAEPEHFSAQVHHTPTGRCDLAVAQLRWPGGALASLTASFLTTCGMPADGFDRMEVFGPGWAVRITPNPRPIELWDDRARWPLAHEIWTSPRSSSGMLAEELRTFCRVVRGRATVPVAATYHDALRILHWLQSCEDAANA